MSRLPLGFAWRVGWEQFVVKGRVLRRGEFEGGGSPPHESHQDVQAGLST